MQTPATMLARLGTSYQRETRSRQSGSGDLDDLGNGRTGLPCGRQKQKNGAPGGPRPPAPAARASLLGAGEVSIFGITDPLNSIPNSPELRGWARFTHSLRFRRMTTTPPETLHL